MKLFCLRHGTTSWTDEARYTGTSDPDLTDAGRQEAEAAGRYLAKYHAAEIRRIVSSPLRRCHETGDIVRQRLQMTLAVELDPRAQEIHYGAWEGRTRDEVLQNDPHAFDAWDSDPTRQAPPGGESVATVVSRTEALIGDLLAAGSSGVLLVSHRTVLRILVARMLSMPLGYYRQRLDHSPAALTIVDVHSPNAGKLLLYNFSAAASGA